MDNKTPIYTKIYATIRRIPPGKVATYGQIAKMVDGCTARMVGYALAALKTSAQGEEIPWQRVINRQGKISPHGDGIGTTIQRELLLQEGVVFDTNGKVDFARFGWQAD